MGLAAAVPRAAEMLSVVEGFKGPSGYGSTSDADLAQQQRVAHATGVPLDHVYTGKGLAGMLACAEAHADGGGRPAAAGGDYHGLLGEGILFWHTGGLLGSMDGTLGGGIAVGRVPSATSARSADP